ncbi:MAG: ABC transporter ATP-binding protein [Clostridia bacterium]|nr:ABC transporter ATP-binding protein [Clostridia bacterium]
MPPAVEVDRVGVRIGSARILEDVSFEMHEGETLGLLGPSGSGKTTVVRAIIGMVAPAAGEVRVLGHRMPSLEATERIGYMAQSDALYPELNALDHLEFFAELYGLPRARRRERIDAVLRLVQLADAAKRPVATYSGGMRRRLSLAIALLHEPRVLLLDEPTVGVDPVLRRAFWDEFARLKAAGVSILVTTHVMDEAERCDRLALIRAGRLIAVGTPAELRAQAGAASIEEVFLRLGGAAR